MSAYDLINFCEKTIVNDRLAAILNLSNLWYLRNLKTKRNSWTLNIEHNVSYYTMITHKKFRRNKKSGLATSASSYFT